jgi:hypothetical protein
MDGGNVCFGVSGSDVYTYPSRRLAKTAPGRLLMPAKNIAHECANSAENGVPRSLFSPEAVKPLENTVRDHPA